MHGPYLNSESKSLCLVSKFIDIGTVVQIKKSNMFKKAGKNPLTGE